MEGRFYSLDQTHWECESSLVEIMTQIVLFSPKSGEDQKKRKKVFTAIWHYIRSELGGFVRANRHFFL